MSRKAKYTPEEKEQAVIDYINGNKSRIEICNELHISTRTIQDWAGIYKKHDIVGFQTKKRNQSYTKEFKIKVVEEYIHGFGSSIDLKRNSKNRKWCNPCPGWDIALIMDQQKASGEL